MQSLTFQNPNPATGTPGTLVTSGWFQSVNDEIGNVITGNGTSLSSNNNQLLTVLNSTYAKLNSPILTGTPLCPDTSSSSDGRSIVNFESMKAYVAAGTLGYTPVHQGGGTGQGTNSVYIGWATSGSALKCTVDSTDLGSFAFQGWVSSNYLSLSGGNVTGTLTYNGISVATNTDITNTKNWVSDDFAALNGNPTFNTAYITTAPSVSDSGNLVPNTWWVNAQGYATKSFVTDNYLTISTASSTYVNGVGSGNTSISNIQLVNSTGASDGGSAYVQVATSQGAVAVPTTGNVSAQLVNYAQPKGSYVDAGTYASDFNSADSRVLFSAYGKMVQFENLGAVDSGTRINFPKAFSDTPIVVPAPTTAADQNCHAYSVDSSGFYIYRNAGGSIQFNYIAIGNR